ncbi:MAG: hypothetical protein CMJ23_07790 [Phycisphaerae bacterium]|nr:hypothetical protein [Phycisphaerae bacterium]
MRTRCHQRASQARDQRTPDRSSPGLRVQARSCSYLCRRTDDGDDTPSTGSLAGLDPDRLEKEAIGRTLRLTDGDREKIADTLGIGERPLHRKLQEHGAGWGSWALPPETQHHGQVADADLLVTIDVAGSAGFAPTDDHVEKILNIHHTIPVRVTGARIRDLHEAAGVVLAAAFPV